MQTGLAVCRCRAGFTGQRCEININECAGDPCANGATCEDGINDYSCVCAVGFAGRDCATPTDPCALLPCLSGGTCVAGGDGRPAPTCACPPGVTGPRCEHVATAALPVVTKGAPGGDPFQWAAVALGVGLVALLLLIAMAIVALRYGPRAGGERDSDAMNNLSKTQKDNLIPPEQLKNTNKKVDLDSDCAQDKSNYKHNYYYLDHNSTKDFKAQLSQDDKSHNYERTLEEKVPLSRMYR